MPGWGFASHLKSANEEDYWDHGEGEQGEAVETVHEAEQASLLFEQVVVVERGSAQGIGLGIAVFGKKPSGRLDRLLELAVGGGERISGATLVEVLAAFADG